jgi:7-carboxy-7-deazaguanine synthase
LKVSEIFHSIQGEGPNVGVPSVFLRLAVCNLKCSWCDTKYSWDWEHYDYDKEVTEMDEIEVERRILSYDCRHLVVTGGEPMLQQDELVPVLRRVKALGFSVEIETNGTILPNREFVELIDQWNVSPKISNSGNSASAREKPECYEFFQSLPNSNFKFVVENQDDLGEILELVGKYGIPREKVILMPESTSSEALRVKSSWLAEICKSEGFRFSTRLHIILYGNRRGS